LQEKPAPENIAMTASLSNPNEEFRIIEKCVYIYYSKGASAAKMSTNFFEKKLKAVATARNYRTMTKLLELAIFVP
jgi:uncharacterized protein (DUF1697 family)